ncbi:uncharacterized protein MYCFIDRAFT_79907 [Pseudocercospora fijiensis CIRAD86]|uniref:SMODS and SLOG-associating 2TM effector domain-containing protein n=1 Tax=Pseudocercospora fijiensis (strain CIRAD86) TaxID=383855 RepID=M3ATA6_PSEFD|nr:uncharacterized protein MYCFIDRAFT_79907 [Pseudocercospora fijiensis CIRAD86]EME80707.1 hypothetical protein MYCFIDRAFT_79907 [Pseudocercospora fijiensis CIRAD86]
MDSTLDFVTRARHAWQEFRRPSEFDAMNRQKQTEAGHGGERKSSFWHHHDPSVQDPDERTPLQQFRLLLGIHQDKSFSPPQGFKPNRRPQASIDHRPSPNMGIYTSVCDKEIKCKRNYTSFSRVINIALGLQLVVAAALTALGAANGSRSAVTVFGAINTIIAGFLTYLKGSGLPNRVKYFQHEWAKLREYIEQRERDFSFGVLGRDDVMKEVDHIRTMYDFVRSDIETNTPDRFVGVNNRMNAPERPARTLSTDSLSKRWTNGFNEKQAQANVALNQAQTSASGFFGKAQGIKEMLEQQLRDLGQMEKEIESHGQNMAKEKKQGIAAQVEHAVKEIGNFGQELEAKAKAETQRGARNAYDGVHDYSVQAAREEAARQQNLAHDYLKTAQNSAGGIADAARVGVDHAYEGTQHAAEDAMAQQQQQVQNSISDASEAGRAAIAQRQEQAQMAIRQISDAARNAVDEQREAAAAVVAPREHDPGSGSLR